MALTIAGFTLPDDARATILPSHPAMIAAIQNLAVGGEGEPQAIDPEKPFKYRTRRIPGSRGVGRFGGVGDYLYVGEALVRLNGMTHYAVDQQPVRNRAGNPVPWQWQRGLLTNIYMPQWAARYVLEITSLRVVRVQDMNEQEAQSEGLPSVAAYAALWDELNARRGYQWANNPDALDVCFRRVT